MGDSQLLNDCLYESYSGCTYYFDDDMWKTSLFLDHVSHSAAVKHFSIRTGSYGVAEQFMFVPAYVFKRFCADVKKSKSVVPFPTVFRELWQARLVNQDLYARLINLKTASRSTTKDQEAALGQLKTNEKYSLDTQCLSKKNILIDILPCVYQIVHPQVREINI